jgi:hypothetical protein
MRPFLNRTDYEPYTADGTKAASEQADLAGPLVDYAAKGTIVELAGMENVNGRNNYRLKLTSKSGYSFHVWIDAQTFLESRSKAPTAAAVEQFGQGVGHGELQEMI